MSIKLITFDLDDTLWDNVPVIISAEASMREWLAINASKVGDLPLEHFASLRQQVLQRHPELKHRISVLRHRVLLHAFEEAGYPQHEATEMADVCFEAFIHARHQLTVFPEAEPMLKALRQHFLLGVITNGNADVQRVGLADYFHFALRAEDIGIAKPDARLFQEALQRGGVDASAAVHVGDHPGDDIAGAQQAGLRAVWFNPGAKAWEADKRPDAEIRSLTELPELLRKWQ
ncbi:2-haloalkanoic acid dehalogenase [Pseudomonas orientalis]|uniref:HAD family hydrolase n=1 Tax=Pseudomonas orientalis TaxID=76758 RepID=UPI000F574703|nr:HAD-IA family hydrolase [Pseudomonas orientalis]AZE86540.1 2-haloalkanoic acid dehalogenase [Pseudomonas orientalis]